jgi:hypothetical protein
MPFIGDGGRKPSLNRNNPSARPKPEADGTDMDLGITGGSNISQLQIAETP